MRFRIVGLAVCLLCTFGSIIFLLSRESEQEYYQYDEELEEIEEQPTTPALWWPKGENPTKVSAAGNTYTVYKNDNIDTWIAKQPLTMVISITLDQLAVFREILRRWVGLISLVIYLPDNIAMYHFEAIKYDLLRLEDADNLDRIRIQIVTGDTKQPPYNLLKNLGWDIVQTNFILLWDITFIPSPSVYASLSNAIISNTISGEEISLVPCFNSRCSKSYSKRRDQEDFIFLDDDSEENYYLYFEDKQSFFFGAARRFQMLLNQCFINAPYQLNSPINYTSWYEQAISKQKSIITSLDNDDLFWGISMPYITSIDVLRPLNNFVTAGDSISQHLLALVADGMNLTVCRYPNYGVAVGQELRSQTDPSTTLCDFRETILLQQLKQDVLCDARSSISNKLSCCNSTSSTMQQPQTNNRHKRPNWNKLIPHI